MIQTTLALLIFLFPLAYSPGPGNMFFAAVGARFGFRASLPAHLGYHLATWIVTAAIGFGFFALMQTVPAALTILAYMAGLIFCGRRWRCCAPPQRRRMRQNWRRNFGRGFG